VVRFPSKSILGFSFFLGDRSIRSRSTSYDQPRRVFHWVDHFTVHRTYCIPYDVRIPAACAPRCTARMSVSTLPLSQDSSSFPATRNLNSNTPHRLRVPMHARCGRLWFKAFARSPQSSSTPGSVDPSHMLQRCHLVSSLASRSQSYQPQPPFYLVTGTWRWLPKNSLTLSGLETYMHAVHRGAQAAGIRTSYGIQYVLCTVK
jgi:hypothetical protein